MEDAVATGILDQSEIGDHYLIPTGDDSELQVAMNTKETLSDTEMTTRDGAVKMKLKGKFPGCPGAASVQVCTHLYTSFKNINR